jgi:cell division protein FtsX
MFAAWTGTGVLWKRGIRRGVFGVLRNRDWLTTFGALTGVCLLLQLSIACLLGMAGAQSLLIARAALHLEILEGTGNQEVQTFLSAVQGLPYVEKMTYITKEQAYAQMKERDPDIVAFVEEFQMANPFPETVSVTLQSLEDYELFAAFLREERWHQVVDPSFLSEKTDQEAEVHELLNITNAASVVTLMLIVLTIGTILFVTVELVRERVLRRAEEVLVEHLSGAFGWTIRIPFAAEATTLLFVATIVSAIAAGVLIVILQMMGAQVAAGASLQALLAHVYATLARHAWWILLVEIALIPLIGWVGAWLGTMRKMNPRALLLHWR